MSHATYYAFDTLDVAEKLEKAGVEREQARAISFAIRESHDSMDVSTTRDLEDVRKDLTAKIEIVHKDLQLEMAGIRSEQKVMRWMLGFIATGVASLIIGMISLAIKTFFF